MREEEEALWQTPEDVWYGPRSQRWFLELGRAAGSRDCD